MITLTTERYSLGELGYELESTKVSEITEKHYLNYVNSSSSFFDNLFGASDTVVIEDDVTVITSISPDKSIKVVRTFEV
jgi:hypothetical protein